MFKIKILKQSHKVNNKFNLMLLQVPNLQYLLKAKGPNSNSIVLPKTIPFWERLQTVPCSA